MASNYESHCLQCSENRQHLQDKEKELYDIQLSHDHELAHLQNFTAELENEIKNLQASNQKLNMDYSKAQVNH
jgi:hypothetical protein